MYPPPGKPHFGNDLPCDTWLAHRQLASQRASQLDGWLASCLPGWLAGWLAG